MAVLPEKTRTKPIVNKILSHVDEALYLVKKGDILEAVHGINTGKLLLDSHCDVLPLMNLIRWDELTRCNTNY
jgi:hypothetical protein